MHGLGDGTLDSHPTRAVKVKGLPADVTSIALNAYTACAVNSGGNVFCWGIVWETGSSSDFSQVSEVLPIGLTQFAGVKAIGPGYSRVCALMSDGSAQCLGQEDVGNGTNAPDRVASPVTGLADVRALSVGYTHSCALEGDGTVACWGANMAGELGSGGAYDGLSPLPVDAVKGAVAIASGASFSCSLASDGHPWCWGEIADGVTGDAGLGKSGSAPAPVPGFSGKAVALAGGSAHACSLLDDGSVACWGDNSSGQIGDGTMDSPHPTPGKVTLRARATSICAGSDQSCANLDDGSVWCWGHSPFGNPANTSLTSNVPVMVTGIP
jgi:hypothetical protein